MLPGLILGPFLVMNDTPTIASAPELQLQYPDAELVFGLVYPVGTATRGCN